MQLITFVLASSLLLFPSASLDSSCGSLGNLVSGCASNGGDQVDVGGSNTTPGGGGPQNPGGGGGSSPAPDPEPECNPIVGCRGDYQVGLLPDVTLLDIASFVPARPTLTGEPAGFGVVGMPTNIVASASEQRIAGTLFDYAVTVRFVPASYRFDYGDGSSRTSETAGASWGGLGQAEFTPTATSHAYAARGTYPVSVTVLYSASVDFGSGNWKAVPGFIESTTSGYDVRVVEVHTGLVDKTCLENPTGPGC